MSGSSELEFQQSLQEVEVDSINKHSSGIVVMDHHHHIHEIHHQSDDISEETVITIETSGDDGRGGGGTTKYLLNSGDKSVTLVSGLSTDQDEIRQSLENMMEEESEQTEVMTTTTIVLEDNDEEVEEEEEEEMEVEERESELEVENNSGINSRRRLSKVVDSISNRDHQLRSDEDDEHDQSIEISSSSPAAHSSTHLVDNSEQENEPPGTSPTDKDTDDESEEDDSSATWNQNSCIVCNTALPTTTTAKDSNSGSQNDPETHSKLKKFFLEYLGVSEAMDPGDTSFPFCFTCTEELAKLMALACKIEFMDQQFDKLRDTLARKTVRTYLCRTRPDILEEDVEPVPDIAAESLDVNEPKPLVHPADVVFNQWKRQYDMILPGRYKKFPTVMKTLDPKQRVSYYRVDSSGKHHFIATVNPESPAEPPPPTQKSPSRGIKRKAVSAPPKVNGEPPVTPETKRVKPVLKDENKTDESELDDPDHLLEESPMDEGRLFQCPLCPKSFNSRSILNYHSRIHSGERPFKCNICDKTFAQRGGLATHTLVHSGEKPYRCEDCGKSFRQKYHLTQHQLIHSGLKPFSCEVCHKSFNVKMNLREHMRRHTGERPYSCSFCTGPGFFRKKMLRDHIVKSHPDRSLPTDLQMLGPTPKFPKHRSGSSPRLLSSSEDLLHRAQNNSYSSNSSNKGKIVRKIPESRLLIKTEQPDSLEDHHHQADDSNTLLISSPSSTTTTLISIDINHANAIPQLNIIEDQSDSSSCPTLELIQDKKGVINLGPPEPILQTTTVSQSGVSKETEELLSHTVTVSSGNIVEEALSLVN